jgi:hypothetical protein
MNKKQLVTAWAIGIIVVLILLFTPGTEETKMILIGRNMLPTVSVERAWGDILTRSFTVLIIGGLLIYSLRSKK